MSEIFAAVLLFTTIVMGLVAVITAARRLLHPGDEVTIRVNRERTFVVSSGGTLLQALAQQNVFLPAGCGGGGTCGLCRIRVRAGGGVILPLEQALIPRAEARRGHRLACQVPVKGDLHIEVPAGILSARQRRCRVRRNRNLATFIKEPVLELPAGEDMDFEAGSYIQVHVPPHDLRFRDFVIDEPYRATWDARRLWELESHVRDEVTRAYSMANHPAERGVVVLNVRIATPPPDAPRGTPPGVASSYLFLQKPGDEVTISGPYGDFFIQESDREMVYIGGGCGMAPLRSHIFDLLESRGSKRRISYWCGARSLQEAFYVEDFEALARQHENFRFQLALSEPLPADRWTGPTGFIHEVVFDMLLEDHPAPEESEYYVCGPPAMLNAVRKMLDELGVEADSVHYDDFGG